MKKCLQLVLLATFAICLNAFSADTEQKMEVQNPQVEIQNNVKTWFQAIAKADVNTILDLTFIDKRKYHDDIERAEFILSKVERLKKGFDDNDGLSSIEVSNVKIDNENDEATATVTIMLGNNQQKSDNNFPLIKKAGKWKAYILIE